MVTCNCDHGEVSKCAEACGGDRGGRDSGLIRNIGFSTRRAWSRSAVKQSRNQNGDLV